MIDLSLPHGRRLRSRSTVVMGIVNATPDSFYTGSRTPSVAGAVHAALGMVASGAAVIDVGGESTRPGSDYISVEEELSRVVPVVEAIRRESDVAISVDTRHLATVRAAFDAGADIVNDVTALRDEPGIAGFAAANGMPVVLMHMLGTPREMQRDPSYDDVVAEVSAFLRERCDAAIADGVASQAIVVDPGIGFGKRLRDNIDLIARLNELCSLGYPVLVGLSRKSFLGRISSDGEAPPPEERLAATIAAHVIAIQKGADIIRVHDVAEAVATVRVVDAIWGRQRETRADGPAPRAGDQGETGSQT